MTQPFTADFDRQYQIHLKHLKLRLGVSEFL